MKMFHFSEKGGAGEKTAAAPPVASPPAVAPQVPFEGARAAAEALDPQELLFELRGSMPAEPKALSLWLINDVDQAGSTQKKHTACVWPWANEPRQQAATELSTKRYSTLREALKTDVAIAGTLLLQKLISAMAGFESFEAMQAAGLNALATNEAWIVYQGSSSSMLVSVVMPEEGCNQPKPRHYLPGGLAECHQCLSRCEQHKTLLAHTPSRLDFFMAWFEYLDYRYRRFGEWPTPTTQIATLNELAHYRNPVECIQQSIAGSFKGVFPLREDIKARLYNKLGMVVTTTRKERHSTSDFNSQDPVTAQQKRLLGIATRDSVRSYRLKSNWADLLPRQPRS